MYETWLLIIKKPTKQLLKKNDQLMNRTLRTGTITNTL